MHCSGCLDKNDARIRGLISPVESITFQCRATAQQVEIASWLYYPVLISFKWCNTTISGPEHHSLTNTLLIQVKILKVCGTISMIF